MYQDIVTTNQELKDYSPAFAQSHSIFPEVFLRLSTYRSSTTVSLLHSTLNSSIYSFRSEYLCRDTTLEAVLPDFARHSYPHNTYVGPKVLAASPEGQATDS